MNRRRTVRAQLDDALPAASILVAIFAVFIAAASGGAYAAGKIGTAQIKDGAVTTAKLHKNAVATPKIRRNAVTSAKIKPRAVRAGDIAPNAISSAKIANGSIKLHDLSASATPAKVINYRYGPHDFGIQQNVTIKLPGVTKAMVQNSQWQFQVTYQDDVTWSWNYSHAAADLGYAYVFFNDGTSTALALFHSSSPFLASGLRVIQTIPSFNVPAVAARHSAPRTPTR